MSIYFEITLWGLMAFFAALWWAARPCKHSDYDLVYHPDLMENYWSRVCLRCGARGVFADTPDPRPGGLNRLEWVPRRK